jgi:hypothetical protein
MSAPLKRAGFVQPLFATSAVAKETVGTLRITKDGRKFRYAKAGTSALAAGKANIAPAIAADVMDEDCASAHAIGAMTITETITAAAAAYPADFFAGGYLQANDGTGEGHQYLINSSSAVALSGTSITIGLTDPIRVALVATTTQFTLVQSPWYGVTESDVEESLMTGVAPMVVPANHFFWNQTGGVANVLTTATPGVGTIMTISGTTAGAMIAITTALVVDICQPYGIVFGTAGKNTEYTPIYLMID